MEVKSFPLYDDLCQDVDSGCVKGIDMRTVCITINGLRHKVDEEDAIFHYEVICALIIHHYLLEQKIKFSSSPYGIKGNSIPITSLPIKLQHIIIAYIIKISGG